MSIKVSSIYTYLAVCMLSTDPNYTQYRQGIKKAVLIKSFLPQTQSDFPALSVKNGNIQDPSCDWLFWEAPSIVWH